MFNFLKRKNKIPIKYATFNYPYDGQLGNDSTSFAAVDLICAAFASLGFDFYNFYTREKTDHNLKQLLLDPNFETTKFDFFYHSAKHLFHYGNCYWYKYDDTDGEITSLFLINPSDVRVDRDSFSHEKLFYYNGTTYTKEKILHIPSRFGFNGLIGQSIFTVCREVFQNAVNLDAYVKNSFNHSVGKRLVIDLSNLPDITDQQIENYKNKFGREYSGVQNSGMPLIKRKGLNYEVVESGVNSNQAQQLEENRRFNERELAKLFRVPIELLNGDKGSMNLETVYSLFLDNAVRPLASQFENAINKFLLSPIEKQSVYFEFSYNNLLKTNLQTRIDSYVKQLTNGILSVNEIRKKENLPLSDAGNDLFIPSNLMPLREEIINAYMAGAKIKEFELEKQSNSNDFHEENPPIGDDKL
jgi:HK97 family phage portal protein